ncbi:MAG: cell division membrane protein [uncultured bacterium]|nr:MAG: cell division membrane protein [uncultured bacterium]HBY73372.1 putative lipid II flippase FtsW [Candidatus Kerfeldbacteria bacterium]
MRRIRTITAHWHLPNYTLLGLLLILLVFGLIMLSSASSVAGFEKFDDPYYFVKRQLLYGVLFGIPMMWILSRVDYHIWKRYAFPLVVINIIFLLMVIVPGIGVELLGARRWVNFGGILFQPSELIKLTFLLYLGVWLEARQRSRTIHDVSTGFAPFMTMIGFLVLMIAGVQKDLGTMVVIAVIAVVAYYVAGAPWKHLGVIVASGIGVLLFLVKVLPLFIPSFSYRANRLTVFLNPDLDPLGIGFHINQALLAIGSGGFFGLGLGHSRQKFNYLPEVSTDSIFAVVAEEMGFIIALSVVALYVGIMWQGIQVAKTAPDNFGKIVAAGIITWITFQAIVNIMAMLSLLPLTGIPLPFISYGSTSMATLLAAVGILINISRQTVQR